MRRATLRTIRHGDSPDDALLAALDDLDRAAPPIRSSLVAPTAPSTGAVVGRGTSFPAPT